jgi:hypothetical protein
MRCQRARSIRIPKMWRRSRDKKRTSWSRVVARGMGWACKTSISPSVRCAYHQGTIGGVEAALSRTSRSRDLHTGRQMSHHKKCNLHIKLHSPHFIKHKCLLLSSLYSDTADLKSADLKGSWGFKSPSGHHYCQGIARQSAYQRQKRSGPGAEEARAAGVTRPCEESRRAAWFAAGCCVYFV